MHSRRNRPEVLAIMGSGELIRSLMAADLIDAYLLMIHPIVLGTGRRMFPEGVHVPLRLKHSLHDANWRGYRHLRACEGLLASSAGTDDRARQAR